MSQQNVALIQGLYAAFATGDVPTILDSMADDIEWREADNFIYAAGNPYKGPAAVLAGVFMPLATEWDGFAVHPEVIHDAGDVVIMTGRYTGTYKATGKSLNAQVVHVWAIKDGKATRFQQYTDTLQAAQIVGR